jgi:hypothetical protein
MYISTYEIIEDYVGGGNQARLSREEVRRIKFNKT